MEEQQEKRQLQYDELAPHYKSGMAMLLLNIVTTLASLALIVVCIYAAEQKIPVPNTEYYVQSGYGLIRILSIIIGAAYAFIVGPMLFGGLKILKPNEALVLTLFGKYIGTLKGAGYFWVNPFATAVNAARGPLSTGAVVGTDQVSVAVSNAAAVAALNNKKISLKAMTLNNNQQKINDQLGNPIIIGVIVIWRVVNTAMAVFNVDNYKEFLSIQCDSALRNIVRLYPYDVAGDDDEKTLRSSSQEIAERLRDEIQEKTAIAGLEIIEARITNLAYAPEIASAMLQRQQASAIIDARKLIVDGAVGMVEMALEKLNERQIVHLDEERKA
ncbi:MAG: SPFH domain-containing protein, partial [Oscillospiraceae bacterium]|nr:SPFH domain-containing protein [Oscillospiraceae bacterium]